MLVVTIALLASACGSSDGSASADETITAATATTETSTESTEPGTDETADTPNTESTASGTSNETPASANPVPDAERQPGAMDMENTLGDHAQLTTIAFDALAFMTGISCADSFFPPGKVSDFFGFQYLRDNEPDGFGHNTAFAGTIGESILNLLSEEQVGQLVDLANTQIDDINQYGYARLPIIDAFRRLVADALPTGSSGLSMEAVAEYSSEIYGLDGQISFDRAAVFADILDSLTVTQQEQLAELAATEVAEWPGGGDSTKTLKDQLEREEHVALMTYAGQMYSWYAGGIEADTYFCPERHGTYFGSFYMKDIPAMLSQWAGTDVTINENLTGEYGNRFLDLLNTEQRDAIEGLVDAQRSVMEELVETREAIATQLRRLWGELNVDQAAIESEVAALSARYGELDGQLITLYATTFDEVYEGLTADQIATLWSLRQSAEHLGLVDDPCSQNPDDLAYLYSESIDVPEIGDTDRFFRS